jgi:adenine-specific DNA-methyltransferase
MVTSVHEKEQARLALQLSLDAVKNSAERNRLGQFATPPELAEDILRYAASLLSPSAQVRFLDPAIGTGAFYSALLRIFPPERIIEALGFELDPHYGKPSELLWGDTGLIIKHGDFTRAVASPRFNMLICNPPYVRHHHLQSDDKKRLQRCTQQASGMQTSGLAGLYCHFLGLAHAWMGEGGIAGWLIPSEFMDVNYGQAVRRYLLERVTLLHIHRFRPETVQFADALVSSAVVWFKNERPAANHEVRFSYGGTLIEPEISRSIASRSLAHEHKWSRFPLAKQRSCRSVPSLADFFQIKRGLVTGDNSFFILPEDEILRRGLPKELFTPILPSPRYLQQDEIVARSDGSPELARRLFLLDTTLSEEDIRIGFPALAAYLEEGRAAGVPERYICRHRRPWYGQEDRPSAPLVCTYLGRGDSKSGRAFRFILNGSQATVANVYLALYPKPALRRELAHSPSLLRQIWRSLNELPNSVFMSEGRVYGGGLYKMEPGELGKVPVEFMTGFFSPRNIRIKAVQLSLFAEV